MVKACQEIGSLKDELYQLKLDNQDLATENRFIVCNLLYFNWFIGLLVYCRPAAAPRGLKN